MPPPWIMAHHVVTGTEMYFLTSDIRRIVTQPQVHPRIAAPRTDDDYETVYVTLLYTTNEQSYPVREPPAAIWSQLQIPGRTG